MKITFSLAICLFALAVAASADNRGLRRSGRRLLWGSSKKSDQQKCNALGKFGAGGEWLDNQGVWATNADGDECCGGGVSPSPICYGTMMKCDGEKLVCSWWNGFCHAFCNKWDDLRYSFFCGTGACPAA